MFDLRDNADWAVVDPPFLDPDFPPEQFVTHFVSSGSAVHATVWIAEGERRKGCVVLVPQAFGGDRLESLIIPLMASGIHVMTFHPRGMWDKEHTYSFTGVIDDVHAAVEFLRTSNAKEKTTLMGNPYRIDPDRIATLGLSGGGGNVAWAACAENEHVKFGIAVGPSNMELRRSTESRAAVDTGRAILLRETAGRVDMETWLANMSETDFDRMSLIKQAERLVPKTLLLVGGNRDIVTPLDTNHKPIARAIRDAGAKQLTDVIFEADHSFLTKRIALARLVMSWLKTECGF
jgi:hypothetical protein